ncbi:MAG: hypothetical protein QW531_04780 [Thermoplasmata archaeon]
MTVKERVGRRRYVVFTVSSVSQENVKKEVERLIKQMRKEFRSVQLIQLRNGFGIMRVLHFELEKAVDALNAPHSGLSIKTIVTAGSVKKAREILARKMWRNEGLRN